MMFYLTLANIFLIGITDIVNAWYTRIPSMVVSVLIITLAIKTFYHRLVVNN
jgi:hypothetical protein